MFKFLLIAGAQAKFLTGQATSAVQLRTDNQTNYTFCGQVMEYKWKEEFMKKYNSVVADQIIKDSGVFIGDKRISDTMIKTCLRSMGVKHWKYDLTLLNGNTCFTEWPGCEPWKVRSIQYECNEASKEIAELVLGVWEDNADCMVQVQPKNTTDANCVSKAWILTHISQQTDVYDAAVRIRSKRDKYFSIEYANVKFGPWKTDGSFNVQEAQMFKEFLLNENCFDQSVDEGIREKVDLKFGNSSKAVEDLVSELYEYHGYDEKYNKIVASLGWITKQFMHTGTPKTAAEEVANSIRFAVLQQAVNNLRSLNASWVEEVIDWQWAENFMEANKSEDPCIGFIGDRIAPHIEKYVNALKISIPTDTEAIETVEKCAEQLSGCTN